MMTTGEFAKLCKTTKETLFHYDRENLLKPKHVSENGYRHYGVEQFVDFDIISMLKETGSSLREIKAYLHDTDKKNFLPFLEAKRLIVKEEKKKLAQREMILNDMIACLHEISDLEYDAPAIVEQEEELLEVFPVETASSKSMPEFVEKFAAYLDHYKRQETILRWPFGVIINENNVSNSQYIEQYFFSRGTSSTVHDRLHIKPKGTYAVLAHKGAMQTHVLTFESFVQQIKKSGDRILGNAYVYDMMNYFLQESDAKYSFKYCIHIL